ncbi:MAG TPA: neutral zinc metallopeptidase [Acidimicrobiales bacterium]|nr:neutral zinc metallopeptidase [Acidimicrobiales bacterium]
MRFRQGAELDTSQVSDRRGAGPIALGGGGLIGLIVLIVSLLGGGGGGGGVSDQPVGNLKSDLAASCRTGADANQQEDCRIVAVVNSVQAYWSQHQPGYQKASTVFFTGSTSTGCGAATSAVGPFYCPLDQKVYIDLGFYDELRNRFGATGGPFAEAYVIAHEYGHHIENERGVLDKARSTATGPQSPGVRVELQADCLAGMWAKGAVDTGFIEDLTDADIADGLNAAASIGDDRIQQQAQGQVSPESWTHGSSEQRQRWFLTGYRATDANACDTFAARTV